MKTMIFSHKLDHRDKNSNVTFGSILSQFVCYYTYGITTCCNRIRSYTFKGCERRLDILSKHAREAWTKESNRSVIEAHTGQRNIFIPTRLTEAFSSCYTSEISLTWPTYNKK